MSDKKPISSVNDFVVRFANVNGSGSASANEMFARAILRHGVPVSPRNIFPSNIQGLPTWYEVRVTEAGHLGARGGVDMMVAMNPQTWDKDVAGIEPGGYLFYDSTKPMPSTKFRDDITVIGVPLTAITNSTYTDPRQRQLFKNIIYLGSLSALLDMDPKLIEQLIGEQYKGKEKLLSSNVHALHLGRDWALQNLKCPIGLRVKKSDKVGDRIFIEGNSAAALGAVYGGATVCAWYPITPSSSLADAFGAHCKKLRHDPETGKAKYAIVQGEDELASIGIVIGASWNGARAFTATSGPGISLMQEFLGLAYFAEIPAVIFDVQQAGPSTGMPTRTQQCDIIACAYASHGDTKHILLFPEDPAEAFEFAAQAFDLAERLQTVIFLMLDLGIGMNHRLCRPLRWDDARQYDRGKIMTAEMLDEGRDFGRGKRWGVYNIQRLCLEFLEALGLREETLPGEPVRRELVFYQLGKFSQAISDFEQIYFNSDPRQKYETFASWLEYQAPGYYAESDADAGYATPDAVILTTVHQAKGMQWPAVFVPCMRANRFPAKRQGGLGLFHVIPETAISDPDRYKGTLDDETRLFYVAVTRAQKYLFVSFSPGSNQLYRRRSAFFDHCAAQQWFSTRDSGVRADAPRLEPRARQETPNVALSFSELKYLFECPYQFKLRFLYGFNPPLDEALGYGKGLHDALAEVHKRAITGDLTSPEEAKDLVTRHLHTPYAYPELKATLHRVAIQSVQRYLKEHETDLERTVHSEKQIQVHVTPGITVDGRIDLVRRLDTDELAIVDFKSTARAQDEDVTRDQLHVYAVGYEELTGQRADLIEVLNLDEEGKTIREEVEDPLLSAVRERIKDAGDSLRENNLPRLPTWSEQCGKCDLAELCREVPASAKRGRRAATGR